MVSPLLTGWYGKMASSKLDEAEVCSLSSQSDIDYLAGLNVYASTFVPEYLSSNCSVFYAVGNNTLLAHIRCYQACFERRYLINCSLQ